MAFLLELKESFKKFYNRYNTYVVPASKFIIALICFIMINTSIGYMDKLKNPVFALLLAVICAFLPGGFTLIVLSAFILIQLYVIAPEFALLVLCVMLLMYLLYFRFAPKTAYILIITAMFCWMKIPFVLPVAIGLCSSVAAVIPVSFGVIMYYIIRTASDYEAAISDDSLSESMKQISYLIESLLKNRQMLVLIIAAAVTIIVVYIIRRQKIDHSWKIAIIVGSITQFLILVVGQIALKSDFNIVLIIIGTILGVAAAYICNIVFFALDYKRTEYVQYEDDEYYYYVKAVPKVVVQMPEKQVKHITEHQEQDAEMPNVSETENNTAVSEVSDLKEVEQKEEENQSEQLKKESDLAQTTIFNDSNMTEDILLTRSLSKELGLDQNEEKKE